MEWVFGFLYAGISSLNPAGGVDVCLASAVFCQVEVSATSWSPVQKSPTECELSECDREVCPQ
jgi:hypothetical protein